MSDEEPQKSGNGFLFKAIVILAAVAGGGFYFFKTAGMPVPFLNAPLPVETAAPAPAPTLVPPPASVDQAAASLPMPDPLAPLAPVAPEVPVAAQQAAIPLDLTDPLAPLPEQPLPLMDETVATPVPVVPAEPPSAALPEAQAVVLSSTPPSDTPEMPVAPVPPVEQASVAPANDPLALPPQKAEQVEPAEALPVEKLVEVEDRLAAIEKTLATLEAAMVRPADLEQLKAEVSDLAEKTKAAAVKKKKEDAVKAARREVEDYRRGVMPKVVRLPRPGEEEAPEARASSPAIERAIAAHQWVLRSAKPGMAWVSEKGSNELKTISVGDALAGIGRVTAIVKDSSGRWLVNGTKGRIEQ